MKKRLFCMLTALIILGGLMTGCGTPKNTPIENQSTANNDTLKVALVQPMEHTSLNEIRDTIKARLKTSELGDRIEIIEKNGNGDVTLLPSIVQSLVSSGVDLIIPIATPAAQAAAGATSSIPIVFSAVSNPIEAGMVTSLTAPDKNITGVSDAIAVEDIFALAKELTPDVKTFGFVYNKGEVNSAAGVERAKAYCDQNGIAYKEALVNTTADLQQAVASLSSSADAFFTPDDNTVASAMATYVQLAEQAGIPIYTGADSMVKDGGFATVGVNYQVLGTQTADMALKVLSGQKISDIPVETIKEYKKLINGKGATALNITVPDSLKDAVINE